MDRMKLRIWHRKTGEAMMVAMTLMMLRYSTNLKFSVFVFMGLKCFNFPKNKLSTLDNITQIKIKTK